MVSEGLQCSSGCNLEGRPGRGGGGRLPVVLFFGICHQNTAFRLAIVKVRSVKRRQGHFLAPPLTTLMLLSYICFEAFPDPDEAKEARGQEKQ